MKFLKDNIIAIVLLVLTVSSEIFHLLFEGIKFDENVNFDSPVYYLINQFGALNFIPSVVVFFLISKENKASRLIIFGLIIWNIKELIDELSYICKINNNVFELNNSFCGQITFISVIALLAGIGYARWRH